MQPHSRFARINSVTATHPVGRSNLYKLAAEHPGLFRKHGWNTLVDTEMLDRILDALPAARLGARPARLGGRAA
jgi:hypothetical protein